MGRQDLRLAKGFDIQIGRDRDDEYRRRRSDSDATVGIDPRGVTVGPRQRENCRIVATTIERDDGRIIMAAQAAALSKTSQRTQVRLSSLETRSL